MSDGGLRYWLNWPHTRQDHLVAFMLFFGLTLLAGAFGEPVIAVLAGLVTVLLSVRLMAWNAEQAAAGEEEDASLAEDLSVGPSSEYDGREGTPAHDDEREALAGRDDERGRS
jgi:hypothetical protein